MLSGTSQTRRAGRRFGKGSNGPTRQIGVKALRYLELGSRDRRPTIYCMSYGGHCHGIAREETVYVT